MRRRKRRAARPTVIFSHGCAPAALSGKLTITQSEPFLLYQMSQAAALSGSATGSTSTGSSGQAVPFRTGVYRCTSAKVDVTPYKRLRLEGVYSVADGSVYGDYHFRRIYVALLTSLSFYTSGNGAYLSHNSSPAAANALPMASVARSVGTSGRVSLTLDVSGLSGSYYIAAMLLLKATAAKGTFTINAIWLD